MVADLDLVAVAQDMFLHAFVIHRNAVGAVQVQYHKFSPRLLDDRVLAADLGVLYRNGVVVRPADGVLSLQFIFLPGLRAFYDYHAGLAARPHSGLLCHVRR